MGNGIIISAVRTQNEFSIAIKSNVQTIFVLSTNVEMVKEQIIIAHQHGKKLFVHIDLADGIGKDVYGIKYLKSLGVDGIISTRTNMIKFARQEGLTTVQRFFIVDSHSVDTTIEAVCSSKPDMIEIMPGTLTKVMHRLKSISQMPPMVAGGLIETQEEIDSAIKCGATAVSTGKTIFWN